MGRQTLLLLFVFSGGAIAALGGYALFGHTHAAAANARVTAGYGNAGSYGMMSGGHGAAMMRRFSGRGSGPGMMGRYDGGMPGPRKPGSSYCGGYGPGMMRGGYGNDATQSSVTPTQLAAVRDRVEAQLANCGNKGFTVGEVMAFTNNDYVLVKDPSGTPAYELLADPEGRWLMPEPPSMMWNTRYGMAQRMNGGAHHNVWPEMMGSHGAPMATGQTGSPAGPPLTEAQAKARANAWLAQNRPGTTTADATTLPGYFTIDVTASGTKVGMLSVHQRTGAIWYHTWHGRFLGDQDF